MAQHTTLHVYQDSGPPEGSDDYTTLILIHGYAWHSGVFVKFMPLAHKHNARIVLVNRRDYPGAAPYTADERALLKNAAAQAESEPSAAKEKLLTFMRDRAREVYDLLVGFVSANDIPAARPGANGGGIVLAGWSYATTWMTALLANVASFQEHQNDVELSAYVRRIILYDGPSEMFGYAPPDNHPDPYNPLFDRSIPPTDLAHVFSDWVSGFFGHGPDPHDPTSYSRRTPLAHPPTTFSTLSPDERAACQHPGPGEPGGSDHFLLYAFPTGAFAELRERALALDLLARGRGSLFERERGGLARHAQWPDVELRMVWCDRSIWEMLWAVACMEKEVKEAKASGRLLRDVTFVRMRGANHFAHWHEPERTLNVFLADKAQVSE